jgi:hypothetical protein
MVPNAGEMLAAGTKGLAPIHDGQLPTQNGTRRKLSAAKWQAHDCVRYRTIAIASAGKRNDDAGCELSQFEGSGGNDRSTALGAPNCALTRLPPRRCAQSVVL